MKKACIFDFDGVIVDSEKYHYLGWQKVAEAIGTSWSYEEYAPYKSAGRKKVIPYLFEKAGRTYDESEFEKFSQLRSEKMAELLPLLNERDVMPGVVDFLKLLRLNGILCAVASASATSTELAKRFNLYGLFDAFVDGNDRLPPKPNPDIYLTAAKRLNVSPCDCAVVEDSYTGICGAKNAGMYCVGFQAHFANSADCVIDTFENLDLSVLNK